MAGFFSNVFGEGDAETGTSTDIAETAGADGEDPGSEGSSQQARQEQADSQGGSQEQSGSQLDAGAEASVDVTAGAELGYRGEDGEEQGWSTEQQVSADADTGALLEQTGSSAQDGFGDLS